MNFITHLLHISYPNPFFVMLRLPISYPIHTHTHTHTHTHKKAKILVKVYNILSNYIPITFTYPFHTRYKKAISLHIQRAWITYPFHYNSFEGSKSLISLHTHFIPIHYNSFTTHFVPKTMMNKVKNLVRSWKK